MYYVILIVLAAAAVVFYARWFENSNIYLPDKLIMDTPDSIDLVFEDIYFNTSDGVKLNGWFIHAGEQSKAVVLFCHGNAGNISHRLDIVRILNSRDMDVFMFDYRGYGRSSGRPSETGTYIDAMSAYEYLLKEKGINKRKIIVFGKSMGGSVAIELAVKVDFGGVILDSVFTSIRDMAAEFYPFLPVANLLKIKYDNISKIKEIKMPKLIIHSTDDEIVPFHHGQRLFERSSVPKQFYRMRGSHNDAFIAHEKEFIGKVNSFVEDVVNDKNQR